VVNATARCSSRPIPRAAWAIVGAAVPVHVGLALATDLSPDEAYYLCSARLHAAIPDHPPLTTWLLALSDQASALPVELRVRLWAVALSFATGIGIVKLAQVRGADREGCTMAAWIGTWALLPMAGGFVTTPDSALMPAVVVALLSLTTPLAGISLLVGALSKVVAIPIGALLALASRRVPLRARLALALGPLLALPLITQNLRFQIQHAYGRGSGGWSPARAGEALGAAISAQALLWSPAVLALGIRRLKELPAADRALVAGLSLLIVVSALVRDIPPEPNWWAPAAIVVIAAASLNLGRSNLSLRVRRAILATVLVPTAIAVAHTAKPFLPLPERADPTARLHGWSRGREPTEAAGMGPYGPAAERCVYRDDCHEIRLYFDNMAIHEGSRR
jgi:hypothetical protein